MRKLSLKMDLSLEEALGRPYTPQQLGKILDLDPRTVIKYADRLGGVEVSPGKWRFFDNLVKESINNALLDKEARSKALSGIRDGKGYPAAKAVPKRQQANIGRGNRVGRERNRTDIERTGNRHGLFNIRKVG